MAYYHIFIEHKIDNQKVATSYDTTKDAVEDITFPFNKGKAFIFRSMVIQPSEVEQINVFSTNTPLKTTILPNGRTIKETPVIYTLRLLLSGKVKGVTNCTYDFISPNRHIAKENILTSELAPAEPAQKKVFIVHGRDNEMKEAVARTLEKLECEAIILHEQPNEGRTIIEKFTDYSNVSFAVVLLSPDGMAYLNGDSPKKAKPRARQNVIFELGFFVGKLERRHTVALCRKAPNFEIPSDYAGVIYIDYDDKGHWKYDLAKELRACGINANSNNI